MVRKKKLISGEILKEPLLDVFLTDLEQISFSLLCPRPSWVAEGLRGREHPDSTAPLVALGLLATQATKAVGSAGSIAQNANKSVSAFVRAQAKQPNGTPQKNGFLLGLGQTDLRILGLRRARFASKSKATTYGYSAEGVLASRARARPTGPWVASNPKTSGYSAVGVLASRARARPTGPFSASWSANRAGGRLSTIKSRPPARFAWPFEEEGTSQHITLNIKIGDYVHCGDKIGEFFETPLIIGDSGRVITLTKTQLTLQKTQPVLFYSEATSHVRDNEWVQRGSPILTLTHQTLVTGDIVQGIPRIEQLFEAVTSSSSALPDDEPLYETLHSQAREIFRRNWSKVPLPTAVRQALEEIQQIIVESIQKVYLSQGVLIADKHIEIVVKQMTSKAQIIDNGNTGFIINEVLPLQKIENANLTTSGKKAVYAPAVVGLTRAALNSDSFVSAASFQETTRVLTRDAVAGKSDFLRGLKEKVVIGDLISAGTGLDLFFLYTLLAENIFDPTCEKMSGLSKPRPNKYESSI